MWKQQLCTCSTLFVHFFAVTAQLRRENALFHVLSSCYEIFFLFLPWTWICFSGIQLVESTWVGTVAMKIDRIEWTAGNSLFQRCLRPRILRSLINNYTPSAKCMITSALPSISAYGVPEKSAVAGFSSKSDHCIQCIQQGIQFFQTIWC